MPVFHLGSNLAQKHFTSDLVGISDSAENSWWLKNDVSRRERKIHLSIPGLVFERLRNTEASNQFPRKTLDLIGYVK